MVGVEGDGEEKHSLGVVVRALLESVSGAGGGLFDSTLGSPSVCVFWGLREDGCEVGTPVMAVGNVSLVLMRGPDWRRELAMEPATWRDSQTPSTHTRELDYSLG